MAATVALSLYGHAPVAVVGEGGIGVDVGAGIAAGRGAVVGVRGLLVVVPIWLSKNLRACSGIVSTSAHDFVRRQAHRREDVLALTKVRNEDLVQDKRCSCGSALMLHTA
jgi:hypothetical protein